VGLPYIASISQNFVGGPFTFDQPSQITLSGTSIGTGEPVPIDLPFNYGATFTAFSDLAGFAASASGGISGGTPPGLIDGTLNGWQSAILPEIFDTAYVLGQPGGGGANGIAGLSEQGGLIIEYNYETPAVAAPEPQTIFLMASGLAGLLLLGARRKFAV
jgi:hypothetical protein